MPWIHVLQMPIFHWSSHVDDAMMWKAEQPTTKSCRSRVSMNTLPWNDACISGFSAWVHSKTIFTRFHSHSAVGKGVHKVNSSEANLEARSPSTRRFAMMQGSGPFLAWLAFMHELILWFLWPCAHFADFSLSIFFSKIFLGSLYGAQQCLQNIFHEGGLFVEPLQTMIIRKPLS